MTVAEFAASIADYMAGRTKPWKDEDEMREAVYETMRLVFNDAFDDTRRLIKDLERESDGSE